MKFVKFFNDLLKGISEKCGVAQIEIDHAIRKVRCNGSARLTTWIDAYDEMCERRSTLVSHVSHYSQRLYELNKEIERVENAMIEKGVTRCPDCMRKNWNQKSAKGTGLYANDWKDCSTCNGHGVIFKENKA